MSKLIDVDEFIRNFSTWMNRRDEEHGVSNFVLGIKLMLEEVQNAPTVDAVPVVRCKDCKYSYTNSWGLRCDKDHDEGFNYMPEDWYCADGERRNNETN